jgi:hypothetical protein
MSMTATVKNPCRVEQQGDQWVVQTTNEKGESIIETYDTREDAWLVALWWWIPRIAEPYASGDPAMLDAIIEYAQGHFLRRVKRLPDVVTWEYLFKKIRLLCKDGRRRYLVRSRDLVSLSLFNDTADALEEMELPAPEPCFVKPIPPLVQTFLAGFTGVWRELLTAIVEGEHIDVAALHCGLDPSTVRAALRSQEMRLIVAAQGFTIPVAVEEIQTTIPW